MNMRRSFLILIIVLMATLIALASAVYYKHITTLINVANPPISIEEAQSPYISSFVNMSSGIYVNISINRAGMTYINNTEAINITLAKLLITHPLTVRFSVSAPELTQLALIIMNSSNAVVAVYPNTTIINLNPGNYIIIEELVLPMNFTGNITVSGTYVVMIKGVEFVYNLNENITITN